MQQLCCNLLCLMLQRLFPFFARTESNLSKMMGEPPLKAVENVSVRPKQRIPGEVKAMGGHRHEVNKVHDISKKNILELKDLIARHESLLKNKKLLATLPDKGEKIKEKLETAKVRVVVVPFKRSPTLKTRVRGKGPCVRPKIGPTQHPSRCSVSTFVRPLKIFCQ